MATIVLTVYRAARRRDPTLGDFWSSFALGEPPVSRVQFREPLRWAGISTWTDDRIAAEKADEYRQGNYLAVIEITDTSLVTYQQTGADPRHISVMGTPAELRSLVVRTLRLADVLGVQ